MVRKWQLVLYYFSVFFSVIYFAQQSDENINGGANETMPIWYLDNINSTC